MFFNFKQPPKQLSNTRVDLENGVAYKNKSLQVFESTTWTFTKFLEVVWKLLINHYDCTLFETTLYKCLEKRVLKALAKYILNPTKHLRWSFLQKYLTAESR